MSPPSTIAYVLPPGFKFVPNDEEVIHCYLKPYSDGNTNVLLHVPIHLVNIYESNPQTLSEEFQKGNDKEWFIITERNKVDQGLSQTKRVGYGAKRQKRVDTNGGYWHATVAAQKINAGDGVVRNKRPLAYYVGKPSEGVKTDWLMQEYSLDHSSHNNDKDYTLCKIYLTPQATKKNKEVGEEKKKQKKGEAVVSVAPVEALEEQLPCNVEYHRPLAPLDSCQPQPHDLAYQQQQFCPGPLDSYQPQPHDMENQQPHNEKLKKEEDVEQLDLHQPDQLQLQQPHDIVYQLQYCLLPEQHQPQPFPDNFSELISFQQQPVMITDDFEDFFAEFIEPHSLDGDEESNNYGSFEGFFDTEGMIKHYTN
ncbi:unnamed protein product [Arabidopsis thaliana]|uniref:(thale cress) hypothetical protein n=1 Tax=Arabidopsis thaliana TaxID=3702 RepID=A0A5S9XL67_ARATH|nr:unnamed protein product [Arabidopsis thaliana]CAD5325874.1 unnamed protein product [Arabidopsis thaliana]